MNIFARIQPQKTFHVTIKNVAKLLGIPPKIIVRIEKWPYVLFIHRRDIGGQFISYRKLKNWQNAIAMKIKNCSKQKKLLMLWVTIILDSKKYAKQYEAAYHNFVDNMFHQQWKKIFSRNSDRSSIANCSGAVTVWKNQKIAKTMLHKAFHPLHPYTLIPGAKHYSIYQEVEVKYSNLKAKS